MNHNHGARDEPWQTVTIHSFYLKKAYIVGNTRDRAWQTVTGKFSSKLHVIESCLWEFVSPDHFGSLEPTAIPNLCLASSWVVLMSASEDGHLVKVGLDEPQRWLGVSISTYTYICYKYMYALIPQLKHIYIKMVGIHTAQRWPSVCWKPLIGVASLQRRFVGMATNAHAHMEHHLQR